jgi:hypothetical protein
VVVAVAVAVQWRAGWGCGVEKVKVTGNKAKEKEWIVCDAKRSRAGVRVLLMFLVSLNHR